MIVVVIIGILVVIVILNFICFQLKSKSLEGKVNLVVICIVEEGYMVEFGSYVDVIVFLVVVLGLMKEEWVNVDGVGDGFD